MDGSEIVPYGLTFVEAFVIVLTYSFRKNPIIKEASWPPN